MTHRLAQGAALACALLLGACATTPDHLPLAAGARGAITSTEVVAPVGQSEIYLYVPPSQMANNGGGGLLLALIDAGIDSSRAHHAETDVKPLRDAAVDYDFDDTLKSDLQDSLSKIAWLHLDRTRLIKDVMPARLNSAITSSKSAAVMITAADYHLSPDGSELTVTLLAELFANSPALQSLKPGKGDPQAPANSRNALYRNVFIFTRTVSGPSPKRDENMAHWAADNGRQIRAALDDGAAKVSADLARDIGGGPVAMAAFSRATGG